MHYGQIISSGILLFLESFDFGNYFSFLILIGRFEKFDFGSDENLKLYGTMKPPTYNLTNIRTKVHLIHGTADNLVFEKVFSMYFVGLNRFQNLISFLEHPDSQQEA